jgi:bifunctional non-homologous end joining protein LigD
MTDKTADQTADPTAARTALAGLRPQPFATGNPRRVVDPIVEPMWSGIRALAAIDGQDVALTDEAGEPITGHADVVGALAESSVTDHLVIDGFLTRLPERDQSGVFVALDDLPTSSQLASRPLIGIRRTRAQDATKALEEARTARAFGPEDDVTFIAIDLLWIDGESLLDVPLLERRRLLESVLTESDLVRRGVFVRPPIDAWVGSWRSLGFTELSFKAANGRYRPGTATDEWVSIPMPRR